MTYIVTYGNRKEKAETLVDARELGQIMMIRANGKYASAYIYTSPTAKEPKYEIQPDGTYAYPRDCLKNGNSLKCIERLPNNRIRTYLLNIDGTVNRWSQQNMRIGKRIRGY